MNTDMESDQIFNRHFTEMEAEKQVSFFKQLWLLYLRNMTTALRNPLQLVAVVILGLVQSGGNIVQSGIGVTSENIFVNSYVDKLMYQL